MSLDFKGSDLSVGRKGLLFLRASFLLVNMFKSKERKVRAPCQAILFQRFFGKTLANRPKMAVFKVQRASIRKLSEISPPVLSVPLSPDEREPLSQYSSDSYCSTPPI